MQEITNGCLNGCVSINNLTIVLYINKESIISEYLICVCKKIEKIFNCCIFQIEVDIDKYEVFPRISIYFKNKILETLYGFNNLNKTTNFIKKYL